MDSKTHVEYALRLIRPFASEATSNQAAAFASLFPQIDRTPATLHRNYAHQVIKTKPLVKVGYEVLTKKNGEISSYDVKRFQAEAIRIRNYLPHVTINEDCLDHEDFVKAANLSFLSHLHLDTFNQPVQAFVPFESYCSGQWELWNKIGDFRYPLYVQGRVEELRYEWLESRMWKESFDLSILTAALLQRLSDLSLKAIDPKTLDLAFDHFGVRPLQKNHFCLEWLRELENELCELHAKHLR